MTFYLSKLRQVNYILPFVRWSTLQRTCINVFFLNYIYRYMIKDHYQFDYFKSFSKLFIQDLTLIFKACPSPARKAQPTVWALHIQLAQIGAFGRVVRTSPVSSVNDLRNKFFNYRLYISKLKRFFFNSTKY